MKSKPGPKPKIGEEQQRKILANLRAGASVCDCAALVRVDVKTVYNAMKADPEFSIGVKEARRLGKIRQLKKITKSKDWKAAAWYLERAYGAEYGRKDRHEHTGANGGPIKSEATHVVDYDAIERELRDLGTAADMARRVAPNN